VHGFGGGRCGSGSTRDSRFSGAEDIREIPIHLKREAFGADPDPDRIPEDQKETRDQHDNAVENEETREPGGSGRESGSRGG